MSRLGVPISAARGWTYTLLGSLVFCCVLVSVQMLTPSTELSQAAITHVKTPALRDLLRQSQDWLASWAFLKDMPREERLALLVEENAWKNSLVMWAFPESARQLPQFVQSWLRCCVLCAFVYYVIGALWAYYTYFCFGDKLFKPGTMPGLKDVLEQIKVSTVAIPIYSALPAFTEWLAESGYTMAYPRVANMGLPLHALYFMLYMVSVEFGVYWMHRGLHDLQIGYKLLHHIHHKYNKEHTLSPFAGLAFHPIDGICQAIPYTWTLLFCPTHFLTHEILLFATGVWTTNIHDCLHGNVWPIMGAGYHTIHHTTYKHNYGHYFVFVDQLFNTMVTPEEYEAEQEAAASAAAAASSNVSSPTSKPQLASKPVESLAAEPAPADAIAAVRSTRSSTRRRAHEA